MQKCCNAFNGVKNVVVIKMARMSLNGKVFSDLGQAYLFRSLILFKNKTWVGVSMHLKATFLTGQRLKFPP
jgi:hypothetical protein